MTEITYVEIPMRQLIHNAGHHKKNKKKQTCFCLPTGTGLIKVSVSCFSLLQKPGSLD